MRVFLRILILLGMFFGFFLSLMGQQKSDWKYVGRTADSAFSLDFASVREDGDFIYFIAGRADIKGDEIVPGESAVSQMKASCRSYKFTFVAMLKKRDGKTYHHQFEPDVMQAEKGSMIHRLIDTACTLKRNSL